MKVNEIFYSLQGEGHFTGTPAVFVRLCGCNLKCWFCDTEHLEGKEMTEQDIVAEIGQYPCKHVVITGGEPTLQLNAELLDELHAKDYFVQIETNGTMPLKKGCKVDWITCSPKSDGKLTEGGRPYPIRISPIQELKVVYEGPGQPMEEFESIEAQEYRLQPCDVQDSARNRLIQQQTVDYILAHPQWKLSLQTHKMLGVR